MNIYFSDLFLENINRLPIEAKKTLKKKLDLLVDNPKHPSLRTKKIKGTEDIFEASINTKLHSKAHRGNDEEPTEAYTEVRRGARRGDNEDESMKATWYNMDIRMTWEFYEDGILLRNIGR
ncbi:MAG: hypothetical protein C0399_12945, partial [Syntrophus sp. (in: bacteria)]|nr:hypothetical protein [Syntrophus sp. (in: bacteria)]